MARTGVVGALFIALGLGIIGARVHWSNTRIWVPVDMPISLVENQIQVKFSVNYDFHYFIEIEAQKKIPFDTLNCLLGIDPHPTTICSDSPVVNASWILTSKGTIVASGSTAKERYGVFGNETIGCRMGSFEGEKGRPYALDVNILSDGRILNVTNPRLRVGVFETAYENEAVGDLFVFVSAAGLVLTGIVLIIVSTIRRSR